MSREHTSDIGWKKPSVQLLTILLAAGIGTALIAFAPSPADGSGMVLPILLWIPLLYAVITAVFYGISRLFMKQWSWIVTLIGVIFLLYTCLSYYLGR